MALATAIAVAGLAVAGAGAYKQYEAGKDAKEANQESTAASVRAEGLREQQMRLETYRRQRDTVRQTLIARATGLSTAVGQGAQYSSGYQGGQAQIVGLAGQSLVGQSENANIGAGLFQTNRDKAFADQNLFEARTEQATGQGLFDFGKSMVTNSQAIAGNIQSATAPRNPYDSNAWATSVTVSR